MIPKLIQRQGAQHLAEAEVEDAPPPGALNPPRAVLELIPESVARENNILPLKLEGRVLHVAVADPSNLLLRDKLSFITNKDIRFVEYPRGEILRAIRRLYGQTQTESAELVLGDMVRAMRVSGRREDEESDDYRDRAPESAPAKSDGL